MANILLAARGETVCLLLAKIGHQPLFNVEMGSNRASRDATIIKVP